MSVTAVNASSPPIFYLDVNLATLDSGISNVQKVVNRSGAILTNPEDYYVSVSRFICATQRVPLWQPQLNTTAPYNNGYNTQYSVTLTYNEFTSNPVYLQIINVNELTPPPTPPVTQQSTTGWGDVYSYYTIVEMVNTALSTAYNLLNTATGGLLDSNPPVMIWNPVSQLFSLSCFPLSQYDQTNTTDIVKIYFNNNYKPFLLGWTLITETFSTTTPSGQDNLLVLKNYNNNTDPLPVNNAPVDPATTTLIMSQDITATWCFVALSKIQVIASLPLAYPYLSDVPLPLQGTTFNNQSENILLDFIVNYADGGANAFQQPILYSANSDIFTSPQKLAGNNPINNFYVDVRWVNLAGFSYQLQTFGLRNTSIRFAFIHKDLIENTEINKKSLTRKTLI